MVSYRTHPNTKVNGATLSRRPHTAESCQEVCDLQIMCVGYVLHRTNNTLNCWHVLLAGAVVTVPGIPAETYYRKLVVCQGERI